jgi:nucleoside permease NupC
VAAARSVEHQHALEARRADLGVLAMKSVLAGLLATCITAALVGMLY